MEKNFASPYQELLWKAFSGQCGKEFIGNPCLMEGFMELERAREEKKKLEREEGMSK